MTRRRAVSPLRAPFAPALATRVAALAALAVFPGLAAPLRAAAPAPVTAKAGLTFDALFAKDAAGRAPSQYAWSPDGRRLAFVFKDDKGDKAEEAIWSLDAASGRREALLRLADLKGKDGTKLDLDGYQWTPKGDALLLSAGG